MSGKYVPPSKREGYKPVSTDLPPGHRIPHRSQGNGDGPGNSLSTIAKIFDTPTEGTFNFFDHLFDEHPMRRHPREPIPYDPSRTLETTPLPPSPPPPKPRHPLNHLIAYIVMFGRAHPLWESHKELWSHTNAEKIMEDEAGLKQNFGRPLPVFKTFEPRGARCSMDNFEGWW